MKSTNSIIYIRCRRRRLLLLRCHLIRHCVVHMIITVPSILQCSSGPITTIVVQRDCIINIQMYKQWTTAIDATVLMRRSVAVAIQRPISILMDTDKRMFRPLNKDFIAQIFINAYSSVHCRALAAVFSLGSCSRTGSLYFGSAKKVCTLLRRVLMVIFGVQEKIISS